MQVYPIHLLDTAQDYRKAFLTYLFVFNDILEPQMLADSLSQLLQIGDWKKLGGRLRKTKEGGLELGVPPQFTTTQPAIGFSHDAFDCDANNHPLGKTLPSLSRNGAPQELPRDMALLAGVPNIPRSLEEVMQQDGPQLYLHVTVFADKTVVSLAWPHYLMDATGLQALLQNWSLVVNHRAQCVVPLLGAWADPLEEIMDVDVGPKQELVLEKLSMGPLQMLRLAFRFLWTSIWGSKLEERLIILSPHSLDRLRQQARDDIARDGNEVAFTSDGDVLAAWATHMLARSQPATPVTVTSIINARFRLKALKEEARGAYVHNMLLFGYSTFVAGCDAQSLGRTALSHRQQLAEQCTEQQVLSYFRMQREHIIAKGKMRVLFGAPGSDILAVNNLAKIDLFRDIDFSGAVIRPGSLASIGEAETMRRQNPPGTIVYYHPMALHRSTSLINFFRVIGHDHSGNLLLEGIFRPNAWAHIFEDLEKLQGPDTHRGI